jgi:perosamine synthetase
MFFYMNVPFFRPSISQAELDEVLDSLKSGWLTTGPKAKRFEAEFAAYVGQKHAVSLNSCTAALHLALEAVGVRAGDTVIVPTMTFAATAEVVRYFDATPQFVDCQSSDFNLDVQCLARAIKRGFEQGSKIRAIIPVHYGGQIADMVGVRSLANCYGLSVIEDAAHCCPAYFLDERDKPQALTDHPARGAESARDHGSDILIDVCKNVSRENCNEGFVDWLPVGALADITCFSFYANKCITTGEGGMACTQRDDYAERMRIMSLHGISKDAWKRFTADGSWYYEIVAPGFKYNLTDIAASIGIHQLKRADAMHNTRRCLAALYSSLLGGVAELILPTERENRKHSWHLYVVRLRLDKITIDRGEVISQLKEAGVTCSVHWMPLHMHPYYREKYGCRSSDFPIASALYKEIVTLPLYPDMTEGQVNHVAQTLLGILGRNLRRG